MQIRNLIAADRPRIEAILRKVGNFNPVEIQIALELVDTALTQPDCPDYIIYVLVDDSDVVQGYVCFGPTPLTDHTFDLYWMAVDPELQHRGYGRQLVAFVEDQMRLRGARLLVLETSSMESYGRTVGIYRKLGYEQVAQIKDFYRPGDDKIIFIKRF